MLTMATIETIKSYKSPHCSQPTPSVFAGIDFFVYRWFIFAAIGLSPTLHFFNT